VFMENCHNCITIRKKEAITTVRTRACSWYSIRMVLNSFDKS